MIDLKWGSKFLKKLTINNQTAVKRILKEHREHKSLKEPLKIFLNLANYF